MASHHEVISAFLDNEPFDATELVEALADPAGRALLIDLLALDHVVQPAPVAAPPARIGRWRSLRVALAAAGLLLAVATGYVMGTQRADAMSTRAPEPTRVINLGDRQWQ